MPSFAQVLLRPRKASRQSRPILNPDVILTGATSGVLAVYNATRTIPIVTITPDDPVAGGFAQSIARPGGNVTGTWNFGGGKGLDFFKLAFPGLARVGAMFNPDDPADALQIPELPPVARTIGVTIEFIEVRDLGNLDAVIAQVMGANVQGVFVGIAPFRHQNRTDIAAMMARLKLPAVYSWREFADAGGLMSYGYSLPDMYRQSARLVDKILKGAKPGELPLPHARTDREPQDSQGDGSQYLGFVLAARRRNHRVKRRKFLRSVSVA